MLEKLLLPFGLHHLLYFPIYYDSAVVPGGVYSQWLEDLPAIAASTDSLRDLAPYSGLQMTAFANIFGTPGIAAAFYFTAKPEKRKKLLVLLIPMLFCSVFCAITEPIEFTFLFVAPPLFVVHAVLSACMATTMYLFGIVGAFSGGLFEILAIDFIPCWANHWAQYLILLCVGFAFMAIYFVIFSFLIKKFDFKTPGREDDDEEIKFNTKQEYRDKKSGKSSSSVDEKSSEDTLEARILEAVGGKDNVVDVTNCATRLRLNVKDGSLLKDDKYFKAIGTHGANVKGKSIQVIIGLDVPNVREKFEALL